MGGLTHSLQSVTLGTVGHQRAVPEPASWLDIPKGFSQVRQDLGSVAGRSHTPGAGSWEVYGIPGICLLWCGQSPWCLKVQGARKEPQEPRDFSKSLLLFQTLIEPQVKSQESGTNCAGQQHLGRRVGRPFQESLCQTSQQPCEVGNSPGRGLRHRENAVAWPGLGQANGRGRAGALLSFPARGSDPGTV